tara:strand:+ start:26912 stop:27193 length:282 start_codon:yes stop_codon:yes gene_type:complete
MDSINVPQSLIDQLVEELTRSIDKQIIDDLCEISYKEYEEKANQLIRESNINELLGDKSYSTEYMVSEIVENPINNRVRDKLYNYINEKRGTN